MRHLGNRLLISAAMTASLGALALTSSSALAAPNLKLNGLKPKSAPEFTSIPVTLKGKEFSTTPGETTVSFGGTAATSVSCSSSTECTATTPFLPEGPVEVTVTVNGVTSAAKTFTLTTYAPPLVKIVANKSGTVTKFNRSVVKDHYPAIFTPGNIYLQIENTTAVTQTIQSPSFADQTVEPGSTAGYNFPFNEVNPITYFTILGAPYTLTVVGEPPR